MILGRRIRDKSNLIVGGNYVFHFVFDLKYLETIIININIVRNEIMLRIFATNKG